MDDLKRIKPTMSADEFMKADVFNPQVAKPRNSKIYSITLTSEYSEIMDRAFLTSKHTKATRSGIVRMALTLLNDLSDEEIQALASRVLNKN